jgi:hypothetical protein
MIGAYTVRTAVVGSLRLIAILALLWGVFYNLWGFATHPGAIPPPGVIDEVVVRNDQFEAIRPALIREGYREGYIEYISPRTLLGNRQAAEDHPRWARYFFAAIPLILLRDAPGTPYVLGDFTEKGEVPPTPEGLTLVADPGNGLVLYKRNPKP